MFLLQKDLSELSESCARVNRESDAVALTQLEDGCETERARPCFRKKRVAWIVGKRGEMRACAVHKRRALSHPVRFSLLYGDYGKRHIDRRRRDDSRGLTQE